MEKEAFRKQIKFPSLFKKLKLVSNSLNKNVLLQDFEFSNGSREELSSNFLPTSDATTLARDLMRKKNDLALAKFDASSFLEKTTLTSPVLNGYSKTQELKLVKIGLASSEQIQSWAEKVLPNKKIFGEVLNANTLHYKTFRPHKGGLFCERIFGPLKDFECACGIKQKPFEDESYVQNLLDLKIQKRIFCPNCDVEYTWSILRRYQLGYIRFASPIVHLWYFKTNPSYLSLILDLRKKDLEAIVYCMQTITLEYYWKPMHSLQLNLTPKNLFLSYQKFLKQSSNSKNKDVRKKRFQEKKKRIEEKKRQNIQIYRPSGFLFQSLNRTGPPSDTAPLERKIEYLEKSFQLSTEDIYSQNLLKRQRLQKVFLEKAILRETKTIFFKNSNKILKTLYKKTYYFLSSIGSEKELKKTNLLLLPASKQFDFKEFQTLKKTSQGFFFFVLKQRLEKNQKRKTKSFEILSEIIHWNQNQIFLLKTLQYERQNFSIFKDPFRLTETGFKTQRALFLRNFQQFVRLNFREVSRKSIYQDQKNRFHPNFKHSFHSDLEKFLREFKKSSRFKIWKDSFFLFLFLSLKIEDDTFGKSRFRLLRNEQLFEDILNPIQFELKNSVSQKRNTDLVTFDFLKEFENEDLNLETREFLNEFTNVSKTLKFLKNYKVLILNSAKILFKFSYSFDLIRYYKTQKTSEFEAVKKQNSETTLNSELRKFSKMPAKACLVPMVSNKKRVNDSILKGFQNEKTRHLFKTKQKNFLNSFFSAQTFKTILQRFIELKQNAKHPSNGLFNNIYTVSYLTDWQSEKDWKYFLYYNTAPIEISDHLIFVYKKRFHSETRFQFSSSTLPILGAHLIQKLLSEYEGPELKTMAKQYQNVLPKLNRYIRYRKQTSKKKTEFLQIQKLLQKRDQIIRRLKLLRKLFKKNSKTTSIVLKNLPVLPPDLRPILKMENQVAASDLNRFYQRILYRNERLKKFLRANTAFNRTEPGFEIKYAQRLLQEAVDNLIQNGKGNVKPETNSRGQPLKSLSEILKGKQGRFRQYLLGKRVDYSGRSVIVVGPTLKIYECGLPFEMAIELFLPFVIKKIFQYNLARTVIGAKTILKTETKLTWELLEEVMKSHPVLLNRAPTLHRLGIQSFQPKLIEGRAILLHPLVCPAFNADFDGDQMAVHVPITVEARTEAWKLMFARNHLISPATGEPMLLPSQDMVLGCYYLTTETLQYQRFHSGRPFSFSSSFYFSNLNQVLQAYLQEKIHLQTPIWLKWLGRLQMDSSFSYPLEIQIQKTGTSTEFRPTLQKRILKSGICENLFVRTTAGRVLLNLLILQHVQSK